MSSGIVFDARVASEESGTSPASPAAPTITAVIAKRVRELREHWRMSGAALAAEMVELGVNWNRTTVAKLESGRRESISVQELLALGKALRVPPVWLLFDPTDGSPVPIARNYQPNPWDAAVWLTGRDPVQDQSDTYRAARDALYLASQTIFSLGTVKGASGGAFLEKMFDDEEKQRRHEEGIRQVILMSLRSVQGGLEGMRELGYWIPSVPESVFELADSLDVDLSTLRNQAADPADREE